MKHLWNPRRCWVSVFWRLEILTLLRRRARRAPGLFKRAKLKIRNKKRQDATFSFGFSAATAASRKSKTT